MYLISPRQISPILVLHVGHVRGEAQKDILSVSLWAPASVGGKHYVFCPERLVASQDGVA